MSSLLSIFRRKQIVHSMTKWYNIEITLQILYYYAEQFIKSMREGVMEWVLKVGPLF